MRNRRTIFALSAFFLSSSCFAQEVFLDGFESGDLGQSSQSGFSWGGTNSTSIVTGDEVVYFGGRRQVAPRPQGVDWTAFEGEHSLRFFYAAESSQSEQRFDLGAAYSDLWVSMWLRVPENFRHRTTDPSNKKLLALWMDGYEGQGDGSTAFWGLWSDGSGGTRVAVTHSSGGGSGAGGYRQFEPLISYPADQGRWMRLVFHLKPSTSRGARNGRLELWRQWEGNTGFSKLHEVLDADLNLPNSGPQGFKAGYLMGWTNPTYEEDTEWLMDVFEISPTPFDDGPPLTDIAQPVPPEAR